MDVRFGHLSPSPPFFSLFVLSQKDLCFDNKTLSLEENDDGLEFSVRLLDEEEQIGIDGVCLLAWGKIGASVFNIGGVLAPP